MSASWGSLQPLLQLAVTLNFGVTLIIQLGDASLKRERDVVARLSKLSRQIEERGENSVYLRRLQSSIAEFNRLVAQPTWPIRLVKSRALTVLLFCLSVVSLSLLSYSAFSYQERTMFFAIIAIILCFIPVVCGTVFIVGEFYILRKLRTQRDEVEDLFSKSAESAQKTR